MIRKIIENVRIINPMEKSIKDIVFRNKYKTLDESQDTVQQVEISTDRKS